jgi:hypothetical protein
MHPSELKNQALVAAAQARLDGFSATAEAFLLLANACAVEAQNLHANLSKTSERNVPTSTLERVLIFEIIH